MANGITLRTDYGPYIVTAISPTQHFYTDTGLSSAVTLPATITSTTTWYCAPGYSGFYTFTCTQVDGSDISPGVPQWVGTTADSTLNPRPTLGQVAADTETIIRANPRYLTTGETVIDRTAGLVDTAGMAPSSGQMVLQYFTALKSETTTNVAVWSGATAAGATPTLVRFGLYTVASNGDLSLVASSASDTAIFASTYTKYTKALSAAYDRTAGQRYAVGVLIVSGAAMPTFVGRNYGASFAEAALGTEPRATGIVGSLSDLPSTVAAASVSDTRRNFYCELS